MAFDPFSSGAAAADNSAPNKPAFDPFAGGAAVPDTQEAPAFDPFAAGAATPEPTSSATGNAVTVAAQSAVKGTGQAVAGTWQLASNLLGELPQRAGIAVARHLGIITDQQAEGLHKLTDVGVRFTPGAHAAQEAATNARQSGQAIQALADYYQSDPARAGDFTTQLAAAAGGLAPALASPATALPAIAGQFGEGERQAALAEGDSPELADAKFKLGAAGGAAVGLVPEVKLARPLLSAGAKLLAGAGTGAAQDVALQKAIKPDQPIDWTQTRFNAILGGMFGGVHALPEIVQARVESRLAQLPPDAPRAAIEQAIAETVKPSDLEKKTLPTPESAPAEGSPAGAPAGPALEPYKPGANLDEHARSIETRFAEQLQADPNAAYQTYKEANTKNGALVIDVDKVRELSPDYAASPEAKGKLAPAVHEPASAFSKYVLARALEEQPPGAVVFTAGGGGSGKSSAVQKMPQLVEGASIVMDSTLGNAESAAARIDQARAAGRSVRINFVYADPVTAFQRVEQRRAKTGRSVPLKAFQEAHAKSLLNVLNLKDRYLDDPGVQVKLFDNSKSGSDPVPVSRDELLAKAEKAGQLTAADVKQLSKEATNANTNKTDRRNHGQDLGRVAGDGQTSGRGGRSEDQSGRSARPGGGETRPAVSRSPETGHSGERGNTVTPAEAPVSTYPIKEFPIAKIAVNRDVRQFKADADPTTGVVEPLGGKYERLGTGPILLWEKRNGEHEVITGRHRLDLARRSGEKSIPAQIVREADGWTQERAMTADAESNIRGGQGTVKDYALYFRNAHDLSTDEAAARGLTQRTKGASGWALGKHATPALWDLYANGQIPENKAVAIAKGAPAHAAAQASALRQAKGKTAPELELYARNLARSTDRANSAEQLGFAGVAQDFADFEREAAAVAKVQAEQKQTSAAIPEQTPEEIKPVEDPAQVGMFARRKGETPPDRNQTDLFAGGETGGDTTFNLAGEEAKDFTGIVDQQASLREARKAADAAQTTLFSRRAPEQMAADRAELEAARQVWRAEAERIAPGLMKRFGLEFGDPQQLVEKGKVKPSELTGWEQAFYDGHERLLYLFDQAVRSNSGEFTRLNLLHEMGHAHWDTLSVGRLAELANQWLTEMRERTGPLFDGKKQLREGVAQGVETDIKEWYAERVAWANHDWARRRAAGQEVRIASPIDRAAQALRILLQKMQDWVGQLRGEKTDVNFRQFLDQGGRFDAAGKGEFARRAPGSAHQARTVAEKMRDAGEDIRSWFRAELTSRGHLPEEVFQARIAKDGRVAEIQKRVQFGLRDLDAGVKAVYGGWAAIPESEQIRINDVLGGRAAVASLDPRLQRAVGTMRTQIDDLSRRLVREGVVGGDLAGKIAGNVGFYLNRSYRKFDDAKWAQHVDPAVVNRAETFIRAELQAQTPLLPVDEARVKGYVEYLLNKDLAGPEELFSRNTAGKDLSIFTKRKEIPAPLRELLGEYQDPRVNYARSMSKMAQVIETHKFLTEARTAGLGKYFQREPLSGPAGSFTTKIAAEGSSALAPLNGLYTTPEIAEAFHRTFEEKTPQNPAWRVFLALNGWTKTAKTVLHPVTQVRNLVANVGFLVANGHWHAADGGARTLEALRADLTKGDAASRAYLARLARHGIVGESTNAGEVREALRDAGVKMTGIEQWTDGVMARAIKLPLKAAARLYQLNDEIFKIYAFENEVQHWRKAMPGAPLEQVEQIASERVRNTLPTYSLTPHAVQRIRRFALAGSFVGFPSEIIRTGYHTIRYALTDLRSNNAAVRQMGAVRLAGIAAAATVIPAAAAASRWLNSVDDKDQEDLRRFLPYWNKNATLLYTAPKKAGRFSLVDLSYLDPWAYLRKPLLAGMRGEDWADKLGDAATEAAAPFFGEGVLAKVLLDTARNRTDQGQPVYDTQAGPMERQWQKLAHVWTALEPGFITQGRRIVKAEKGEVTASGRAYNLNEELTALLTGARSQSIDVSQAHSFKAGKFDGELNLASTLYRRVRDRQGTVDPGDVEAARAKLEATRAKLYQGIIDDTAAAGRLQVDQGMLLVNLLAANLSKNEAAAVLGGVALPYIEKPLDKMETVRRAMAAQAATAP